jgi:hypothetical protein
MRILRALTLDGVVVTGNASFNELSRVFGNTVGLYATRKGKLYRNTAALRQLNSVLEPLDILLEKTPFRLTDKFIPGYFGHVAIWVGTEEDLKSCGVWDEPEVQKYHDLIRQGKCVLEALRSGVQLNTLAHFLNVDDLAVLRPVAVTGPGRQILAAAPDAEARRQQIRQTLRLAFRQLGKGYDFNFDVETTDKIVCSELAYVTFTTIPWPATRMLGRYTFSPDEVARLAWDNEPLQLITLYHQGQRVDPARQLDLLKTLMRP